jgi:hypothetical protein
MKSNRKVLHPMSFLDHEDPTEKESNLLEEVRSLKNALNDVVDAWEKLKGNRHHSISDVQNWMSGDMYPAIEASRRILGRSAPVQ